MNTARKVETREEQAVASSPARPVKAANAFRTISEVAETLNVPQHVLRFWETKFSQIRPLKRGGGRRYYRPEDVALLKRVHELLYSEGYTIKGVQKLLKGQGKIQIVSQPRSLSPAPPIAVPVDDAPEAPQDNAAPAFSADSAVQRDILLSVLSELKELRQLIRS